MNASTTLNTTDVADVVHLCAHRILSALCLSQNSIVYFSSAFRRIGDLVFRSHFQFECEWGDTRCEQTKKEDKKEQKQNEQKKGKDRNVHAFEYIHRVNVIVCAVRVHLCDGFAFIIFHLSFVWRKTVLAPRVESLINIESHINADACVWCPRTE